MFRQKLARLCVSAATGLSIESSDTLTTTANQVDFNVRTVKPWSDEFKVDINNDGPVCVQITGQPQSTTVLVGRDRRAAGASSFNPRTLGACN